MAIPVFTCQSRRVKPLLVDSSWKSILSFCAGISFVSSRVASLHRLLLSSSSRATYGAPKLDCCRIAMQKVGANVEGH